MKNSLLFFCCPFIYPWISFVYTAHPCVIFSLLRLDGRSIDSVGWLVVCNISVFVCLSLQRKKFSNFAAAAADVADKCNLQQLYSIYIPLSLPVSANSCYGFSPSRYVCVRLLLLLFIFVVYSPVVPTLALGWKSDIFPH